MHHIVALGMLWLPRGPAPVAPSNAIVESRPQARPKLFADYDRQQQARSSSVTYRHLEAFVGLHQ